MTPMERAHAAVTNAIRSGSLTRKTCEAWGVHRGRVEAHHDDYSRPLEVRWLCRSHHRQFHEQAKRRQGPRLMRLRGVEQLGRKVRVCVCAARGAATESDFARRRDMAYEQTIRAVRAARQCLDGEATHAA